MTNEKRNKEGAYASLTGFHRAVPIILFALAIFITLCFFTQNTGALGKAIGGGLLGIFSIGGYFVPALFALHALFYPSDIQKKRLVSRIIFSVLLLIFVSALAHAISVLGEEVVYSGSEFYKNGKENIGGGWVGGSIAFIIIKAFGEVGLIIMALAVFVIYLVYFFAGDKNPVRTAFKRLLYAFVRTGAKAENKIKNMSTERKEKKAAREIAQRELEEKRKAKKIETLMQKEEALYNDDFFAVDNGLKELKIEKLGVNESRRDEDIEKNPTLQEKVFPKGRVTEEDEPRTEKKVYTDYGFGTEDAPHSYETKSDDIIIEENEGPVSESVEERFDCGLDASADSVFTKDFSPYDFEVNERLATKQSSKAQRDNANDGINEFAEPINRTFTEEDIAAARRRAEFEMRKSALLKEEEERKRREAERASFVPYVEEITFGEEPEDISQEPAVEEITSEPEAVTEVTSERLEEPTVAPEEERTEPSVEDRYRRAAEYASFINDIPREEYKPKPAPEYKPYVQPETEPVAEEETMVFNRSVLLDETEPATEEPEAPRDDTLFVFTEDDSDADRIIESAAASEEKAELSVFDFEDEEEEGDLSPEPEEDDAPDYDGEAIPEDKQNPQINEYKKMFSFFNEETEEKEPEAESDEDEDAEEDDAPDYEDEDSGSYAEAENPEEDEEDVEDDLPPFDYEPRSPIIEKPKAPEEKKAPKPDYSNYKFPSLDMLAKGQSAEDPLIEEEIAEYGDKLIDSLLQFDVRASIKSVDRGPRITRYEIVPARGVRVQSVIRLFDDIALNLAVEGIRMEAPIPGKSAIGVEIPNKHPTNVMLRDLLESEEFMNESSKTFSCIGKDVTGNPIFGDISKMPHILVAGATGMGKSVCINSILISILYKAKPDEVKFIMIDPKTVEFTMYNGIPHLLVPVVTDAKQAAGALMWAIDEMNRRYELMAKHEVRKLDSYNDIVRANPELGDPLPKIIIVIDELNDLMQQVRKPVEGLITNITQKARAAGIHMIIGTQRPSVDVITGVIKANVPSRISCKVTSFTDSKTILDQAGAEKLLDKGDMLFWPVGKPKPIRVQGAFVSDNEVEQIMRFLKSNVKGNIYDEEALEEMTRAAQKCSKGKDDDDIDDDDDGSAGAGLLNDKQFLEAVDLAIKQGKISTSLIQRKISIGYGKAAKFIDVMEDLGLVSEPNGQKPRDVLVTRDEWHEMLSRRSLD